MQGGMGASVYLCGGWFMWAETYPRITLESHQLSAWVVMTVELVENEVKWLVSVLI